MKVHDGHSYQTIPMSLIRTELFGNRGVPIGGGLLYVNKTYPVGCNCGNWLIVIVKSF